MLTAFYFDGLDFSYVFQLLLSVAMRVRFLTQGFGANK